MKHVTTDILCKRLGEEDLELFRRLISLFGKTFGMETFEMPGELHLTGLLQNPSFVAYAALKNDTVLGGLTAYLLPAYYRPEPEVFIYDVAIGKENQRMGIGTLLLGSFKNYCGRELNVSGIFVAASKEDSHALSFYRAAGGVPEEAVFFNFLDVKK